MLKLDGIRVAWLTKNPDVADTPWELRMTPAARRPNDPVRWFRTQRDGKAKARELLQPSADS